MKGIRYGLAVLMLLAFLLVLVTTVIDVAILMNRSFLRISLKKTRLQARCIFPKKI